MPLPSPKLWRLGALVGCGLSLFGCDDGTDGLPASAGVHVLERELAMPGLDRTRTLRIYLPPDYAQSARDYPVLYMHDGQNLFDEATSYAGEWAVDETLDKLFEEKGLAVIVVGIDNGGEQRMTELNPWSNAQFGAGEGREYTQFIVDVVKPYIDRHYRTLSSSRHTAIMGSSMGGLISHYAIFEHPQVFSRAGIFSPSYWAAPEVFAFSDPERLDPGARLYLLAGEKEGDEMVDGMRAMIEELGGRGRLGPRLVSKVVPGGEHNEALWRDEFGTAISWLLAGE